MAVTFSLVQADGVENASITFNVTAGNLLTVHALERSGTSHTAFSVTDTQGGTWTKHVGEDGALGNSTFRRTHVAWSRVVDTTGTCQVSVSNGTANVIQMLLAEWSAGAAVTWAFQAAASNDNDVTANATSLATGTTASVAAGNLMLVGCLGIKRGNVGNVVNPSTWASSALTNVADEAGTAGGANGQNGRIMHVGMLQESGAGTKASTATFTSADATNSGLIASMMVFSATEGGGGSPPAGTVTIGTITPGTTTASVAFSYDDSDQTGFEYRLDGGTAASAGTTSPLGLTGLDASTEYDIEIRAVNASGAGAWSTPATFTTNAISVPSITTQPLKNNTGTLLASTTIDLVAALDVTDLSVVATWAAIDTEATGELILEDAALVEAADYLVVTSNTAGTAVGVRKYTAA